MEKDLMRKIIAQDDKEIRKIEKAKERFERKENSRDLKELKRYERVLDKFLFNEKNWL